MAVHYAKPVVKVDSGAASVELLPANAARKGLSLINTDTGILYVKYGETAALDDAAVKVPAGATWVMDPPIHTGRIDGIWDTPGAGQAIITEQI